MEQAVGNVWELERLKEEYLEQARVGVPMSVREWYERKLAEIRQGLRRQHHGKKLGEILLEMGVIDRRRLEEALAEQRGEGSDKLLGEILLEMGAVDSGTLKEALERQVSSYPL